LNSVTVAPYHQTRHVVDRAKGKATVNDELRPYIVYRVNGQQAECALWQLQEGQKALALFLSGDTATAYRDAGGLGDGWQVFRPGREALLQLLEASYQAGVVYAVLDPDRAQAKTVFDLKSVLAAVRGQA
jgi:hypothetical protein